jgi:hypothetical protein
MDEINLVTLREIYPKVIEDEYFKGTPFEAYVRDHCLVPFDGGAYMQNTFLYAPMIGGAYGIGQTFNTTKRQTLSGTFFDPKYYEVAIPEYKEIIQVVNKGSLAIFSLVDVDLRNAMNTISAITAIDMSLHGQASGGGVVGNRILHINGWEEAYNDGITPSWTGSRFPTYGTVARNGVIGSAMNSTPVWCGKPDGSTGPIQYPTMEETYQTASRNNVEPNLGVGNKAAYAYMKERLQVQQRFQQEKDPIWGMTGFRFNSAMCLKDDYFPSLKYGVNDPNLGNYLTGTFTVPSGVSAQSGLPTTGTTVTVGECWTWFNTQKVLFRLTDDPEYGYGFSGFLPAQDNTRVVGYIKAAQNMQFTAPWSGLSLYGIGG